MYKYLVLQFFLLVSQTYASDLLPLMHDVRFFIPMGYSHMRNEVSSNRAESFMGFGVSKNLFETKNFIFWPSLEYNYAETAYAGSNDVYVKPIIHSLIPSLSAGYKLVGNTSALIPFVGLRNRFGIVNVQKKVFNIQKSHSYFLYNIGPFLGVLYQIKWFGFALDYGVEVGRQKIKQQLAFTASFSWFFL